MVKYFLFFVSALVIFYSSTAQENKTMALQKLDSQKEKYASIALQIWDLAEMGYQEKESSALLQKTLTSTVINLFGNPDIVKNAKLEFEEQKGADFVYKPLLGDRPPALDYRK